MSQLKRISLCISLMALAILSSCRMANGHSEKSGEKVDFKYSTLLKIEDFEKYSLVEIKNPWDTTKLLGQYLLIDKEGSVPEGFEEVKVIRTPIEKSVVFSAIHASLINELGAGDAIKGVCDAEYVYQSNLVAGLKSGEITDCGNSMNPSVEKIIRLSPGAVFVSPFENVTGPGKLDQAGLPVVECADYMEVSPLARAEWIKFYGRLFGESGRADSIFSETEKEYTRLRDMAAKTTERPKVLLDRIYGQSWNVPGGNSTMGIMIRDAGGDNPFGSDPASGSLKLSPEKVLYEAGDADIWLIRYAYDNVNLYSLAEDNAMYTRFKAYKEGNVYGSNSSVSNIFEDVAFHPQWLLADLISLFHPELTDVEVAKTYFDKVPAE